MHTVSLTTASRSPLPPASCSPPSRSGWRAARGGRLVLGSSPLRRLGRSGRGWVVFALRDDRVLALSAGGLTTARSPPGPRRSCAARSRRGDVDEHLAEAQAKLDALIDT